MLLSEIFYKTVENQNYPCFQIMLTSDTIKPHLNVDYRSYTSGRPLIMVASSLPNQDFLKSLLPFPDIDVNAIDNFYNNSLFASIQAGYSSNSSMLISHNEINLNHKNLQGYDAMWFACKYQRKDVMKDLITKAEEITPLAFKAAVSTNNLENIKLLIESGRVKLTDELVSVFDICSKKSFSDVAEYLLSKWPESILISKSALVGMLRNDLLSLFEACRVKFNNFSSYRAETINDILLEAIDLERNELVGKIPGKISTEVVIKVVEKNNKSMLKDVLKLAQNQKAKLDMVKIIKKAALKNHDKILKFFNNKHSEKLLYTVDWLIQNLDDADNITGCWQKKN